MDPADEQPLFEFIMADIVEQNPNLTEDALNRTKSAIQNVITGRSPVAEASRLLVGTCECGRALDKLQMILAVGDTPIPFNPQMADTIAMPNRKKTHPWTTYEDQRLLAGIHRFGLDDWTRISAFVGNGRTRAQCSQRWFRGLDPRISKTRWTEEQDERLLTLVAQFGEKRWTSLAKNVPDRCDVQCRYRYRQLQKEPDFATRMMRARARVEEGHGIAVVDDNEGGKRPRTRTQSQKREQQMVAPAPRYQMPFPQGGMVMQPMLMNGQVVMMASQYAQPMPVQMVPVAKPGQPMPMPMPMAIPMGYQPIPMAPFMPSGQEPAGRRTSMGAGRKQTKPKEKEQKEKEPEPEEVSTPQPPQPPAQPVAQPQTVPPPVSVPPQQQQPMFSQQPSTPSYMISGQNSFMLSGQGSFSGWEKFGFPFDDPKQGGTLLDWNAGISPQVSSSMLQNGFRM